MGPILRNWQLGYGLQMDRLLGVVGGKMMIIEKCNDKKRLWEKNYVLMLWWEINKNKLKNVDWIDQMITNSGV